MAEVENEGATVTSESEVTTTWSTGDPATDWSRFAAQFDRMDKEVWRRMSGLMILDGVLLCVLVAAIATRSLTANESSITTLRFLLPWVGLSASLAIYWTQYRAYEYRRELQRAWIVRYSTDQPAPYGMAIPDPGTLHGTPAVLFGAVSSVLWLALFAVSIASVWLRDQTAVLSLNSAAFVGSIVLGVVSLVAFYSAVATHFANKSLESNQ